MYQLTDNPDIILRTTDGAFIPVDPGNRDYAEFLAWRDAGNTPDPVPLDQTQRDRIGVMVQSYHVAIAQDIMFTTAGGVMKAFQADAQSAANAQAMVAAYGASGVPTGFYWVAKDNSQVPFTTADLQGLAKAMGDQGWAAFQRLQDRKTAILAATTAADVAVVTW